MSGLKVKPVNEQCPAKMTICLAKLLIGLLVVLTGQINFTSKRKKKTIHFQAFQEDKHLFPFMFLLVRLAC